MYIEGIVIALDNENHKVKLKLPDYDDFITGWLSVAQTFTLKNFSRRSLPALNSLVAAVVDEGMEYGCIIGSLYNGVDKAPEVNSDDFIQFSDGSTIAHNEDEGGFLIVKNLKVEGDIIATGDITDKNSSMQDMRDIYNSHEHGNGNNGSDTSTPDTNMA